MREDEAVLTRLREVRLIFGVALVPEFVLVLDGESTLESRLQQHGDELRPVEQSLAGNAIAPPTLAVDSHLAQHRLDDLRVLGVPGADAVAEAPGRRDRVDVLADEV